MNYTPKRYPRPNAYGTWHVTTEGDCEGRTTRDLGTHTGFFDEIAFKLANQSHYKLQFDPVDPVLLESKTKTGTEVFVSLGIESGTWDMDHKARRRYFEAMLAGRDVLVEDGQYHASVKLVDGASKQAQEAAARRVLVEQAKSKLTPEELEALRQQLEKE